MKGGSKKIINTFTESIIIHSRPPLRKNISNNNYYSLKKGWTRLEKGGQSWTRMTMRKKMEEDGDEDGGNQQINSFILIYPYPPVSTLSKNNLNINSF